MQSKNIFPETTRPYIWAGFAFLASSFAMLIFWFTEGQKIQEFYAANLRSNLFSGFVSVAAFLLALKTFLLIELKRGVYDSPEYKERFDRQLALNPKLKLYRPFTQLGRFLLWCVLSSMVCACLQMTVGMLPYSWASVICEASAASAMVLLFFAWWYLRANLGDWFDLLDQ